MNGIIGVGFLEREFLDQWELPFGTWIKEIVFWLNVNASGFLDAVEWPFRQLLRIVVDDGLWFLPGIEAGGTNPLIEDGLTGWLEWPWLIAVMVVLGLAAASRSMMLATAGMLGLFGLGMLEVPWPFVILAFVLLGLSTRNLLVGIGAGAGLFLCGILGFDYWNFTVQTIGMIVVAVIVSSLIGIPMGIFAARSDQFWNSLRPVLDGMQVVHPFVYLLPVIFFWGTGRTPGTIATMVFALPPIVRLTNLGIRQVPGDVVEAARAYGARESAVLLDVQLPLARPAIMTGLNQTLLMALSMVGIVAIIAGGGLGQPILRGVNTTNIPLAASSGLALYLVGVILDRISQPEAGELRTGSLWRRVGAVLAGRNQPVEVPPPPVAMGEAA